MKQTRFRWGYVFLVTSVTFLLSAPCLWPQTSTGICCGGGRGCSPCGEASSGGSSGGSGGAGGYSGPSAEEIKAERQREAEEKHLDGLQRQAEQERLEREAEQKRAQEEFLREVQAAAVQLKGVSHDDLGLKGVGGNSKNFGLKGISPEVAAANINTSGPDASARDVSTASKQLTCAADITNHALKHVLDIVSTGGSQADLDEIKYLAGEASNALQGNPVGVQCASSGALRFEKPPDLKTVTPAYKVELDKIVRDSQNLYDTEQQAATAQHQVDDAKSRVTDLEAQRRPEGARPAPAAQTPPKTASDSDVDKAYAEQKAVQQRDQEKIDQVHEEQKKLQQQQFDALALLRKAQAELDAVNSQKLAETRSATSDVEQLKKLETGNVPQ
jgi:hypothetical protein